MKMTKAREKMLQGQAEAADQQPWRCVKCGEPVSQVRLTVCKCLRDMLTRAKTQAGREAVIKQLDSED